ncbi:MAG: nitronate monooxygenase family protein [Anaerobutyricum sp.]|nr:nitronate monooxygenase family protein [Eubacterium sp.]MDY6045740.1 nitronate monooxygenase family protein [Anaerobutyricum sp.]
MKMENKLFTIGTKSVKIPLVQGGMGIGISLGGLAGAVAKEGGIGMISAAQIGYREPDFYQNPLEANRRAIHSELEKARAIAPDGIIGFNVMVAMNHYEEHVREIVAAGADLIVSGAGLPVDLPAYTEGSDIALAPIVSTEKSAKVILKYWDKKYKRTADLLVIEGPSAGGHLGFIPKQLEEFIPSVYDEEVKKILGIVRQYEEKYDRKIPVVLAGGIRNHEDYLHAMSLGVDGIQVATRFVTTVECDADERFKEAYLHANKEDIQIVKSPVGMPGRAICNPLIQTVSGGNRIPPEKCLGCIHTCKPTETPYCITEALIHAVKGELDQALLFCGEKAYEAKKIETVKEVVDSFQFF